MIQLLLKEYLDRKGFSLTDLGEQTEGLSLQTLYTYAQNKRFPSRESLEILLKGVSRLTKGQVNIEEIIRYTSEYHDCFKHSDDTFSYLSQDFGVSFYQHDDRSRIYIRESDSGYKYLEHELGFTINRIEDLAYESDVRFRIENPKAASFYKHTDIKSTDDLDKKESFEKKIKIIQHRLIELGKATLNPKSSRNI